MRRVAILALVIVALLGAPADALRETSAGPVLAADAPDPAVVYDRAAGAYFAVTTQAFTPGGFARVPLWRSSDLRSWSYVANALPRRAAWTASGATHVAPAVARFGARWNLYYAAIDQAGQFCIGVATSERMDLPFADDRATPLVCAVGDGNSAIDPSVFVDGTGQAYLLWKNEGSAQVLSAPLTADGRALAGAPVHMYNPDAEWTGNGVENPQLVLIDGRYVLLFAYNLWLSPAYATGYAECAGPQGPCAARGPVLTTNANGQGPGGLSTFYTPAGERMVAYHAWVNGVGYDDEGMRALFVGRLAMGEDGPEVFDDLPPAVGSSALPFGAIDVATTDADGRAWIEGWVLDRDVDAPVEIHAYVKA